MHATSGAFRACKFANPSTVDKNEPLDFVNRGRATRRSTTIACTRRTFGEQNKTRDATCTWNAPQIAVYVSRSVRNANLLCRLTVLWFSRPPFRPIEFHAKDYNVRFLWNSSSHPRTFLIVGETRSPLSMKRETLTKRVDSMRITVR